MEQDEILEKCKKCGGKLDHELGDNINCFSPTIFKCTRCGNRTAKDFKMWRRNFNVTLYLKHPLEFVFYCEKKDLTQSFDFEEFKSTDDFWPIVKSLKNGDCFKFNDVPQDIYETVEKVYGICYDIYNWRFY